MNEPFSMALGLGFVLGLKHATEADHLVAVTTIVSEQRSVWRSMLVGALWGTGHTAALLLAGVLVILLRVAIPAQVATALEFGVALMIIGLGGRLLYFLFRQNQQLHVHAHSHDTVPHAHLHFHDAPDAHSVNEPRAHDGRAHSMRLGWRPLVIGMMHGLAGSAALTLLVLAEVMQGGSRLQGLAYLFVFGIGSIGGMLLMSGLIGLPFVFTAVRLERVHTPVRLVAGVTSILFGLYYAWEVLTF